MYKIRRAQQADLDQILEIYEYAREQMRLTGNPHQWGTSYPPAELVEQDIASGISYVITDGGRIAAVFVFIIGEEPTYGRIEEGCWLNKKPYGTIHRLAGGEGSSGIFDCCRSFCEAQIGNIRADTHLSNTKMQHLLERSGYVRCGRIYVADGTPRIAYQKGTQHEV